MGKAWVVFKREYLERVRSKWFVLATIMGPVVMGLVIILPTVLAARSKSNDQLSNVVILDATGTDLGMRIAKSLAATTPSAPKPRVRSLKAEQVAAEEVKATTEVMQHQALGYLVLDSNTVGGKEVRYAGRNASALTDINSIERVVRQSLLTMRLEKEGIDAQRVALLTSFRIEAKTEKISDRGKEGGGGMSSIVFGYIMAFLLYIMIAIYGQSIMRGVLEEKTNRVAEVVVSSVKPDALLAGKILGSGSVALTQVIAWVTMSYVMYLVRQPIMRQFGVAAEVASGAIKIPSVSPGVGLILLAFFVLGFAFYAALFGAVGSMVSNQEDVQQAATPVMLMLVSSIIFMSPILLAPSSTLAVVMSILPFSAPLMMPMRMALIPVPWYEIAGSLASVAVGCAVAIWVAARIYRVGLLMYGKKPSFRELGRWIRMA